MSDQMAWGRGSRFLLTAAAFIVVVAGMREAATLIVPFLLAVFLAVVCSPTFFWLTRRGFPPIVAVATIILIILFIELLLGAIVGASIDTFIEKLPSYQERLREEAAALLALFAHFGVDLPRERFLELIDPGAAMALIGKMLTGLGGMLTNMFLILITVIFMLFEAGNFPAKLRTAFPQAQTPVQQLSRVAAGIKRYLAMKTLISLGTGVAVGIWVALLGVDFPVLWALLAFFLNYVPNIGSVIAAIPAVLLTFIQFGFLRALIVVGGYVLINVIFSNFIEPKIMGRRLGLSTLVVFLSLVFWAWVLGPIGMVLSVPLTMTVKIALENTPDTRWIAVLLGDEPRTATASEKKGSKA
ncbi:Predicted PurR-regulated permease PerM [Geoalkalibacter ferrihydriticus]|uniref:Predicted PurR-regulated permease PerM n=1 Tax=Geoalkalibacter ferrihydriticus TaxID=392333 RepID=A0A1G9T2T5_9BACT|nr:AI-2E family transporter [Geoalkalibacter ferrihydriticus]SDM41952.1 Predicted PurR-regulated permease PerM [Geoalkalibacter ferrihydriticus]